MTNNNEYPREVARNDGSTALTIISWLFGVIFFAIGFVNTFWGNDPGFGIFIILLSLLLSSGKCPAPQNDRFLGS